MNAAQNQASLVLAPVSRSWTELGEGDRSSMTRHAIEYVENELERGGMPVIIAPQVLADTLTQKLEDHGIDVSGVRIERISTTRTFPLAFGADRDEMARFTCRKLQQMGVEEVIPIGRGFLHTWLCARALRRHNLKAHLARRNVFKRLTSIFKKA